MTDQAPGAGHAAMSPEDAERVRALILEMRREAWTMYGERTDTARLWRRIERQAELFGRGGR